MLLCNHSNANSWSARLLRSPPLEHRWPGGEPGLADRTPGWPFRTMGRRSAKAAPQTAIFCTRVCPGLLNWEVEHAKGSGRRRQPSERSEQLRAKRAGRQNGTQTRAARATTRPGTDSPFTPSQLASRREAGSRNGEMNWGEGWNPALPGCSGPTALNFGGIRGMVPEEEEKTTPSTRKASSPYPPSTWAPGPLPLKRACYQPGVYKVK